MGKLAKHLWDQLVNDEDAAKHWLTMVKTWVLAMTAQVMLVTKADLSVLAHWSFWQWAGVAAGTLIAGGAAVKDPVIK